MDTILDLFPIVAFLSVVIFLGVGARTETHEQEAEWKKEEERKARIRALSPQPSYEERMGVSDGPTGTQNE